MTNPDDKDRELGFYEKYFVERKRDTGGKHSNCTYFVLDMDHDKFAKAALETYISACEAEYPQLAKDLREQLNGLQHGLQGTPEIQSKTE